MTSLSTKHELKLAYLNVRSILPKIDEIKLLLANENFHVLGIGETWLDATITDNELKIDEYNLIRKDRNRHGGGVAFYIHESLTYRIFPDCGLNVESLWINIKLSKHSIKVCNIYRPPNSNSQYFDSILDELEKNDIFSNHVVIMGDMNHDYKCNESLLNNPIYLIESLYNFKQLVNRPTRVTPNSSTLLDIILSNKPDNHLRTCVFPVTLSDHYLVCTVIAGVSRLKREHNVIKFRDYKHFDTNKFLQDIDLCFSNPDSVDCNTVDSLWTMFKSDFLRLCDIHAPIRTMRLKNRSCPWVNNGIVQLIYSRNYAHKKAVKTKSSGDWNIYRGLRGQVSKAIATEKRNYFNKCIADANKPKLLWKQINKVTCKNICDTIPNNVSLNDFADHFSTIGLRTVHSLQSNGNIPVNKNPKCLYKFEFKSVNFNDVSKVLGRFGTDSSLDVLGFDCKLLCLSAKYITPVLVRLINLSLSTGLLPDDWKLSRVTPVFKGKGDRLEMSNYRPIAVIAHVSKVIEKLVQGQLMTYLLTHNLISLDQSSYRQYHSTTTAIHRIVDDFIENINDGMLVGTCFLDVQKCFDTISHNILRAKLGWYGISDKELNWFINYLQNRSQIVSSQGRVSKKFQLNIGVPQGSVIGPMLFMLYVNDLNQNINTGACNMYADDTVLYCTGKTITELQTNVQCSLNKVANWFTDNQLVINQSKTEVMVVKSKYKQVSDTLDIYLFEKKLNQVECSKYLGLNIDGNLTWNAYVNELCRKIGCKLSQLKRIRNTVSQSVLLTIYNAGIQPCIDYAISVWGQTSNYNISKIQRLQNFAARLILNNFDYINFRGQDLCKSLNWMIVRERCKYFTILLMFKCIHGLAPAYLCDQITMLIEVNNRCSRSHDMNVYIPMPRSELSKMSFNYIGATFWNALPNNLKECHTLDQFKYILKCFIKSQ